MKPRQTTASAGPDEPHRHATMNRAERRRRGIRGPLVPEPVTRAVARQLGLTPQQVTTGILQAERNPLTPEETAHLTHPGDHA